METTTNYDMPPRSVCAISSFECFVRNPPVSLRYYVLCSAAKSCYCFDWLKFDPNLGWPPASLRSNCHKAEQFALYLQLCVTALSLRRDETKSENNKWKWKWWRIYHVWNLLKYRQFFTDFFKFATALQLLSTVRRQTDLDVTIGQNLVSNGNRYPSQQFPLRVQNFF